MEITELAESLGMTPDELGEALIEARNTVKEKKATKCLADARAKSSQILGNADDALAPLRATIAEKQDELAAGLELIAQKRDQHAAIISALEAQIQEGDFVCETVLDSIV